MYDPGRDAAERYPDWVIRHRPLSHGIPEVMCQRRKVILIEQSSDPSKKRCSLAHAVAHLDLHHTSSGSGFFDRRQEAQANGLAAIRLVPLEALARALSWSRFTAEVAAELDVDRATLEVRRRHMHKAERAALRRLIAVMEEAA